jgi:hypothetical protein
MLTDAQLAQFMVNLYAGEAAFFDIFDPGPIDSICWGALQVGPAINEAAVTYIFLRGSVTLGDWLRDAMAIANPFTHDALGPCHPGFYLGMHELWLEIQAKTQGPWILVGHSLGAGRGYILGAIMVLDGKPPLRQVYFGSPKPGFSKLASIVGIVPTSSYRNGNAVHHDLVTDLPATLPPEEYVQPDELILVSAAPPLPFVGIFGIFAWHHIALYAQALGSP